MPKKTPNHNAVSSGQETRFLQAINAAVAVLTNATHSETAVFDTFAMELRKLGLNGVISMLDEAGENLIVRSIVMPDSMTKAMQAVEKIIGIEGMGFTYSLETALIDQHILETKESLYLEDNSEKLQQVFPKLGFIGKQALRPFSGLPAILTPIIIEGNAEGTLYLAGIDLQPEDVSAISIFAKQISNALLEARMLRTIQQTEAKYRRLFETANDAILVFDVVTERIISANPMAETMTEYSVEELYKLPLSTLFPNGQLPLQPSLFDLASQKQAFMVEAELHQKGGETLIAQISANPFELQGRLLLQGFIRDITEEKRFESLQTAVYQIATIANSNISLDDLYASIHQVVDNLMAAKNFYIALYDRENNMMELPYFVDEIEDYDGKPYPVSDGLTEYVIRTGLPQLIDIVRHNQLIDAGLVSLVGPSSQIWLGVPLKNNVETFGAIVAQNYQDRKFYTEQDKQFLVFVSGQIASAIERKRAEEERRQLTARLEQQVNMLNAVLSSTPDNFHIYDLNGRLVYMSLSAAEMIGRPVDEMLGKTLNDLELLPGISQNFEDESAQVLATGAPFYSEVTVKDELGSRYYEYSLHPVRDKEGEVIMFVFTSREITERKLAEEALHHTQKMESLGILAGGVAHDFNNLLMAMLGQTTLAKAKLDASSPAYPHIEKAVKATERASELTTQLLAYSGRGQFTIEPLSLNTIILDNRHLLDVAIPEKVSLHLNLAKDLPLIDADPGQIQQVVMNLIINAAEAMAGLSGQILMETMVKTITKDDDHVWWQRNQELAQGTYVSLRVEDNGEGMDSETLDRIFDPFFTTKFAGRGLGLAAVLGIVRGHQGGLHVWSKLEEGTTFELIFPVSMADLPKPISKQDDMQKLSGMVLVIDDEKPVLEAVQDILELQGIDVLTAENGRLGLEIYKEHHEAIDLVLLDWSMPEMNGTETFECLREFDLGVRVILSSGYSEMEITDNLRTEQLVGYLQKPYSLSALAKVVKQHIT